MTADLYLVFSGPDLEAIFDHLVRSGILGAELPIGITVEGRTRKVSKDWREKVRGKVKTLMEVEWETGRIIFTANRVVVLRVRNYEIVPKKILEFASKVPFTIASTGTVHRSWTNGELGEKYNAPSFADGHWPHGWACFFKGEGHKRLVSRRWLEFGPWRFLKGANDTSMVEFHDIEADAKTALAQARIGHQRMGITPEGGFIQTDYVYRHDLKGLYYPEDRKMHIVVNGREVSQQEMLDACASRLYQKLGPERPLDDIVYVFVEEEPALAHLFELWVRELECHVFRAGLEVDLEAGSHPQPMPPQWARDVEAREGSAE
jgi:hypothetical protein